MVAVHLLVVDVEGLEADVLSGYPFESVPTWRVQFESKLLAAGALTAARKRLREHGFRPLQLGPEQRMSNDVWHHPGSAESAMRPRSLHK